MPIATTTAAERIARVLAGQHASANAEGGDAPASPIVEQTWRDHLMDAVAVLKTLREPDEAMAQAGDADMWERMVQAAIEQTEAESVVL
ncbi:MAG: hypothetical protein E7773_10075 [Sphingomonas sp.]|uniref:hypothetical protein n=1 Tax=Sphingomonas sp. TaxID=28214 RepID=UPI0012012498|nr:hypothetical protein [Sphingomonas sp.]THD36252.1 MAG: hypothetical protein E7773_10075 [Sphingomonas sp.]